MKKIKKQKSAFTLAEVLIALTIIGVIAAITVPALSQRTNKQEYVSALQKAYSVMLQATNAITAENGSPGGADSWVSSIDKIHTEYIKHLKVRKACRGEGGCFPQYGKSGELVWLNGRTFEWPPNMNYGTNNKTFRTLVLDDGMQVLFHNYSNSSNYVNCSGTRQCFTAVIDVNGEKGPNRMGRDTFWFKVTPENGFIPNSCGTDCHADGRGYSCACKVLREGAMNY